MKIAFASALSLGVTSDAEYMDFELSKDISQPELWDVLKANFPAGVELKDLAQIHGKHKALMAQTDETNYRIEVPYTGTEPAVKQAIDAYSRAKEAVFHRETPKKKREIETKEFMLAPIAWNLKNGQLTLKMDISLTGSGSVKPIEVL